MTNLSHNNIQNSIDLCVENSRKYVVYMHQVFCDKFSHEFKIYWMLIKFQYYNESFLVY